MNKLFYNGKELDINTNLDNYTLDYVDNNGDSHLRIKNNFELISDYKRKLAETDYKAIKYAEGVMSLEEYAPVKIERQMYRNKINELEKTIM